MSLPPENPVLKILLWPFAICYGLIIYGRNLLYDLGIIHSVSFNLPVISVGNLAAGGTGKTPHVEYLLRLLNVHNVATLSRGYKRKTAGFIEASEKSTASDIGDEPLQIKNKFVDLIVAVDRNRVEGIKKLQLYHPDLDCIILDDAFQHRRVKPGIQILLMDYHRPISQDHLLPMGLLREGKRQVKRADIVIITKSPGMLDATTMEKVTTQIKTRVGQELFFTTLSYGELTPVFAGKGEMITRDYCRRATAGILMVTGIADPSLLKEHLVEISPALHEMNFRDHHYFNSRDIENIRARFSAIGQETKVIVTTEKDAARLREIPLDDELKSSMYYIPIEIKFLQGEEEKFNKIITDYVRKD